MKIHEYQGKEVLKTYGVTVPRGHVAFTPEAAVAAATAKREALAHSVFPVASFAFRVNVRGGPSVHRIRSAHLTR